MMKKKLNLKMRNLCLLMLITPGILLSGCNSGGTSTNSSPSASQAIASTKVSDIVNTSDAANNNGTLPKAANNAATPGYAPLDRADLGWGYDPSTNTVVPIALNSNNLISPLNASFQIVNEASQYNDYSTFAQDLTIQASAREYSFSGGVGVSYGLYSGSIKAGYNSSSQASSGSLAINKAIGLAGSVKSHFYLSPTRMTSNDLNNTGAAIYNAAPSDFKTSLDRVRNATDDYQRAQAVLNFYSNYGTHFVSSVTKGYMGVVNSTLTQTATQSSEAKSGSVSASFSSPFVNAEANYSQSSASSYAGDSWNYSSTTFTTPDDNNIRQSLTQAKSEMDNEVQAQAGTLSFDKLSQAQQSLQQQIKLPDLSTLNVTPDPTKLEKATQEKATYDGIIKDLQSLDTYTNKVLNLMGQRDAASESEKQQFNDQIKTTLDTKCTNLLAKFDTDGMYANATLTSDQSSKLVFYKEITEDALTKTAQEMKAFETKTQASQQRQDNLNKLKTDFNSWLADVVYPSNKGEFDTFALWYDSKSIQEIQNYSTQYNDYLKKQGVVPQEDPNQIKMMHKKILLRSKMLKATANLNEDQPVSATLDFDIIPWADIFPELNSTASLINSSPTALIKLKLLKKFNHIIDARSYLLLCGLQTTSAALQDMYTKDSLSQGISTIKAAIANFANITTADTVTFAGKSYDLTSSDDISALQSAVDSVVNSLAMIHSNWYKASETLMTAGLVSPQGDGIGDSNKNLLLSSDMSNPAQYFYNFATSSSPSFGIQFASIVNGRQHNQSFTVEPIVTDASKFDQNSQKVTSVQILFSNRILKDATDHDSTFNLNGTLDIDLSKPDAYTATGAVNYLIYDSTKWYINNTSPGNVKFNLYPLNGYSTESIKTALGGDEAAKSIDPQFKLFYSGQGSATLDKLYYMNQLTN